jgi:hypothetical protein
MESNPKTGEKRLLQLEPIKDRSAKVFNEQNAIEFLEARSLVGSDAAILQLENWSTDKIEELSSDLFDFLEQQRTAWRPAEPTVSPFTCVASASIRADSGCSDPECRKSKLDTLARFAAMYGDIVFLPVPLQLPSNAGGGRRLRQDLFRTVHSILELRPLVERGIVRPTVRVMHYCEEHARQALLEYRQAEETISSLSAKLSSAFEFSYELCSLRPRMDLLMMRGPEEYIEHGALFRILQSTPSWAGAGSKIGEKQKLPPDSPAHLELTREVLSNIARDVIFHQQFGPRFDATYLTDLTGEATFLGLLSKDDDLAIRTAQLFAALTHEIPMITNLPIRNILQIRDENPASFELYRASLKKIVSESIQQTRAVGADEAHELYEDVLAPALAELRVEAKRQYDQWVRKSVGAVALAIGAVVLGATGLLQSPQILGLLGGATIKGLLDQFAEAGTQSATSNKLYFLLRLQSDAQRRTD